MSESANLPMNFGGINESKFSDYDASQVLIFPVSYEGTVFLRRGNGRGSSGDY